MKKDKKPTIEELLKRIEALENRLNSFIPCQPFIAPPQYPSNPNYLQPHY